MILGLLLGNTPTSVGKTHSATDANEVLQKHPHERGEDFTLAPSVMRQPETPPRAWGRRLEAVLALDEGRNTPTSVGKTVNKEAVRFIKRKHPHERGEDR